MSTATLFRRFNFILLCNIMDKFENIIEAGSFTDPKNEIFNKPYIKTNNG